ncbi:MAG: Fic family protein [Candidatus Woesearchaeota archaeon]
MAGKYDLFYILYSTGGARTTAYLLRFLKKSSSEYHAIYQTLLELEKKGLIKKGKQGFQAIRSKKEDLLFQMIRYCMNNGIDYNKLLNKKLAAFISKALLKGRFTIKDFKIRQETYKKYIDILSRSGFLTVISRKPLEATIPYNSFLGDLLAYFGHKVHVRKDKENYLEDIKKEISRFKKLEREYPLKYKKLIEDYEFKFIQHSLNLEGNPITLPETISLLKEKVVPRDMKLETAEEVQNYEKAVQQMLNDASEGILLDQDTILNYHYLAMRHKPFAGQVRKIPVYIKNNPYFKVAKAEEIGARMDKLLKEYKEFMKNKAEIDKIINFAAYFHNEFQFIHPFQDGNSRTTRLLAFHILRGKGIPIIDIPLGLLEGYLFSTKGAKRRDDDKLGDVLQKVILYNLKSINEQLRH